MKARFFKFTVSSGSAAREYIRLVCGNRQSLLRPVNVARTTEGAAEVLEAFRKNRRHSESDYILTGKRVIAAMNEQLREYRSAGEQFADWVTRGSRVSISGEDRRFTVLQILWDREAIRVQDDEGQEYVIPVSLIGPWPKESDEWLGNGGTGNESRRK
jgi:hypothetical protein